MTQQGGFSPNEFFATQLKWGRIAASESSCLSDRLVFPLAETSASPALSLTANLTSYFLEKIETLSHGWDDFTFPLWSQGPPLSVTTPVFLHGDTFFLSSFCLSICALSLTSSWTFLCDQASVLSSVYSTILSNSWFHPHVNVFDPFRLNSKTSLDTSQLPLTSPCFFGKTCLCARSPFLCLTLTLYPTFWPYSLPDHCLNSPSYQKGMTFHALSPLDTFEHLVP